MSIFCFSYNFLHFSTTLPKSFKVILKTLQNFEINHLGVKVININICAPLCYSHNFLFLPNIVTNGPHDVSQGFKERFWKPSKNMKKVILATNGLGIKSQGFWTDHIKSPRNWNEVTKIDILLKLAQNFICFSQVRIIFTGF